MPKSALEHPRDFVGRQARGSPLADGGYVMVTTAFERHDVRRLYSVAHLFPRGKRSGIYVLCFANGERYVGQTVNIVTRFGTHRRKWTDIESLLFARCPRAELNDLEIRTIRGERSRGHPLRNITHSLGPLGKSDLDPIVTKAEQYAWLNGEDEVHDVEERAEDLAQRRLHASKYAKLKETPYLPYVALITNLYVQGTIPKPRETERTFWSLSAMPSTNRNKHGGRLATLSINKMETLYLSAASTADGDVIGGRVNVSRAVLEGSAGSVASLRRSHPHLDFTEATYETSGGDCISIGFVGGDVIDALKIPGCQRAARQLNLMLMRKGPTFQWRWHCYDLADWAVRPELSEDELQKLFADPTRARP